MTQNPNKRPAGIAFLSMILTAYYLIHINTLIFRSTWYKEVFAHWPVWAFQLRLVVSWTAKILGLIGGIGIVFSKEIFRKITIGVSLFYLCFIYLRHPYGGFKNHVEILDQQLGNFTEISLTTLVIPAMIAQYLFDIIFFGAIVYYLTRPSIKAQFKQ